MNTPHTPLPWHCSERNDLTGTVAIYANGPLAYVGDTGGGPEEQIANAAFIVRAVNNHGELVSALRGLLDQIRSMPEEAFSEQCEGFDVGQAESLLSRLSA
jgi:hypothetical protein